MRITKELGELCKQYQIGSLTIEALKNLDLDVENGDFVSIQGPSGSGKTTLLNLIGGLDKPTSGKVVVFGHDLGTYDEDFLATFRSAYVGFVFQSYNLISTLTAIENVAFAVELAGWPRKRILERSENLLKSVGVPTFSEGERHQPFVNHRQEKSTQIWPVKFGKLLIRHKGVIALVQGHHADRTGRHREIFNGCFNI